MAARRAPGPPLADSLAQIEREVREQGASPTTSMPIPGRRPAVARRSAAAPDRAGRMGAHRGRDRTARALLDRVLADIYGRRNCCAVARSRRRSCSARRLPAPVRGCASPASVHLFHYAADLARLPDGQWWVVDDRAQAPSGTGYALRGL